MKRKQITAVIISVVLITTAGTVFAEEKEKTKEYELDKVLVTADREKVETINEAGDEPVFSRLALPESSKAATQIFNRVDIEAMHPKTVFDVILQGSNMMFDFYTATRPEGLKTRGGDNIGLIVDGIYVPTTQATKMLANFPINIIESIKIVRDSTVLTVGPLASISTRQGASVALSAPVEGYIIITTRKPKKNTNEMKASYDSLQSEKFSYYHGEKNDDSYYAAAFNLSHSAAKDDRYNASNSNSFYFRTGFAHEKLIANMSIYVDRARRELERMESNGVLGAAKWKYDPMNTYMIAFDIAKPWDEDNTTSFSFGYSQVKSTLVEDYFNWFSPGLKRYGRSSPLFWSLSEHLREYNLAHTISSGKNTMKFGTQALVWDMVDMQGYQYANIAEEVYGFYLNDEYNVNNKLTVDGGMRIDKKHFTKQKDSKFNDKWAEDTTSLALGAVYKINPVYKLSTRVSYSKQPAYDYLLKVSDKKFEPEVRLKYETGITANYSTKFNLGCTLFYYDIDNYKYAAKTSYVGNDMVNSYDSADVVKKGFEISANGSLSDNLTYNANYAYLNSSNENDNKTIPHNEYSLRLNYKNKDYVYNLSARHVGPYSRSASPISYLGNITTIDASISKKLDTNSAVTLFGKNITDQRYSEAYMDSAAAGMSGYRYNPGAVCGIEFSRKF